MVVEKASSNKLKVARNSPMKKFFLCVSLRLRGELIFIQKSLSDFKDIPVNAATLAKVRPSRQ